MDEVLKRRIIGAAVLVGAGVLIPVIVAKLAQPSVAPTGESVVVYEITPAGETRAVGEKQKTQSQAKPSSTPATKPVPESPEQQSKAPAESKSATAASTKAKTAEKPETLAPTAAKTAPPPEPKAKPKPAPEPKPKPKPKPAPKPPAAEKPAPKPPAKTAPTPPPAATTNNEKRSSEKPYYVVQVGSFGDEGNAIKLMQSLSRDFPVFYREGQVSGKRLYRVRVGPFDSRESANIVATRLREKGYKTQTLSLP